MTKYLCLCGMPFKRKKDADKHAKLFIEEQDQHYHHIVKKNLRGRFIDWIIASRIYWKFTGIMVIYFVLINHFNVSFSIWEGLAMGIGLGLAIE